MNAAVFEKLRLGEFVHGGQVLAAAPDGRKIFVWGGLPGEIVDAMVLKKKRSYYEALATIIHEPSVDRVEPVEPNIYLSTSPWQIVSLDAEWRYKDKILQEVFKREDLDIQWEEFRVFGSINGYRNKMEYGFYGDDRGLHLAHFVRGTHGKVITEAYSSPLPTDSVNAGAEHVIRHFRQLNLRAGDLKTVVIRASQNYDTAVALFVKNKDIRITGDVPQGFKVYYSNPKSPASVPTELLQTFGDTTLVDVIAGHKIRYDVLSFFQVNVGIFEQALLQIKEIIDEFRERPENKDVEVVDFYSGVGAIGIVVGAHKLVESDINNIEMAKINTKGTKIKVVHAAAEKVPEHITSNQVLIVDPPRAGLHKDVVQHIVASKPKMIVYLSCDPATQARDVKLLSEHYLVSHAQGYNFFPRTPHIECLIVLERK